MIFFKINEQILIFEKAYKLKERIGKIIKVFTCTTFIVIVFPLALFKMSTDVDIIHSTILAEVFTHSYVTANVCAQIILYEIIETKIQV